VKVVSFLVISYNLNLSGQVKLSMASCVLIFLRGSQVSKGEEIAFYVMKQAIVETTVPPLLA